MLNKEKSHSVVIHDPVCGMEIKETNNSEKIESKGKTYYFCTLLCKIQFEQDPGKYVKKDDDEHIGHHHH